MPELNADGATLAAISDGLAAFRQGAGHEMGILLDSNFNFKTEGYIKVARTCEPFTLFWLEIDSFDAAEQLQGLLTAAVDNGTLTAAQAATDSAAMFAGF